MFLTATRVLRPTEARRYLEQGGRVQGGRWLDQYDLSLVPKHDKQHETLESRSSRSVRVRRLPHKHSVFGSTFDIRLQTRKDPNLADITAKISSRPNLTQYARMENNVF